MNKFVYFIAVGLAFTVLQVATVEADPVLTIDDPLCNLAPADRDPGCPNFGNADAGGGDDGVALTIDDPRCIVAPEARHHRCPGFVAP